MSHAGRTYGCRYLIRITLLLAFLCSNVAPATAGWPLPAGGTSQSGGPEVLFTFDDGPDERYTPQILDELAKHQVQAIFFWVGHRVNKNGRRSKKRQALVARAIREGHLVANHTINHVHLCRVSEARANREIDENARIYRDMTGLPMTLLFRAPYGDYCGRLSKMLAARRLTHLHWDIDGLEWRHRSGGQAVYRVVSKLRRLQGRSVILMHDTKRATAYAVPRILRWIRKENEKRQTSNKPEIRILSGSDFIAERMQNASMQWLKMTTQSFADQIVATMTRALP